MQNSPIPTIAIIVTSDTVSQFSQPNIWESWIEAGVKSGYQIKLLILSSTIQKNRHNEDSALYNNVIVFPIENNNSLQSKLKILKSAINHSDYYFDRFLFVDCKLSFIF